MTRLITRIENGRLVSGTFGEIPFGPWGIEFSDRHSFATLTDIPRNAVLKNGDWHLAQGRWQVGLQTRQTNDNTLHVQASFTPRQDAPLQDAVIRLTFDQTGIATGDIGGQRVTHRNSDKYRLHPVDRVTLTGRDRETVTVVLTAANGADRFTPYLYLRDRDNHWIIHARLLPNDPVDHVWLRWANRLFTLSAPDRLAKAIWNIPGGKALFWRLRERIGRHCPEIQAVPLNTVKAGQTLMLEVTCHFR